MPGGNRSIAETIASDIADDILRGDLDAGSQIPSLHDLVARYSVSSSTANAATKILSQRGLLERRRGLGMFVAGNARAELLSERTAAFDDEFVTPALLEARRLGISVEDVHTLIAERGQR